MADNAWLFCGFIDDVIDGDPAYVLSNDGITWLPIRTDIPNPDWINDGSNTSPDVNGQTRFITQVPNTYWDDDGNGTSPDADGNPRYFAASAENINFGNFVIDGTQSIETIRRAKAQAQLGTPSLNVEIRRATVTVTLA